MLIRGEVKTEATIPTGAMQEKSEAHTGMVKVWAAIEEQKLSFIFPGISPENNGFKKSPARSIPARAPYERRKAGVKMSSGLVAQ